MEKQLSKLKSFIKENKTVFGVLAGLFILLLGIIGYNVFVGEQWGDLGITEELKQVDKERAQLVDVQEQILDQTGIVYDFPDKTEVKADIDTHFETEFGGVENIDYQDIRVTEYIYNKYGGDYWSAYKAYLLPDFDLAYGAQKSLYIRLMNLLGQYKYANLEPIYTVSSFLSRNIVNGVEMGFLEMNNTEQNFDGYLTPILDAKTDKTYMNSEVYELEVGEIKIVNPQLVYQNETQKWLVSVGVLPTEEVTVKEFVQNFKDIEVSFNGKTFILGDDQGGNLELNGIPYSWVTDEDVYMTNMTEYIQTNRMDSEGNPAQVDSDELSAEYNTLVNESYVSDVQMLYSTYEFEGLPEPKEGPVRLTINKKDVIIPLIDYRGRVGVR